MFLDLHGKSLFVILVFISDVVMNAAFDLKTTVLRFETIRTTKFQLHRSSSSTALNAKPKNVCIIGGGLAGLSATFHLLEKIPAVHITIIDKSDVGKGGASSVAGGLLHPFSPKGKILHLGLKGLSATNRLIEASRVHNPDCILREKLFRLALTEDNIEILKQSSLKYPEYARWLNPDEMKDACGTSGFGGLLLQNGCKVIHMPRYLDGLWKACCSTGRVSWLRESIPSLEWQQKLASYDTVVYAAGSGLFYDCILDQDRSSDFPIELVRGQSLELELDPHTNRHYPNEAILAGKYITPLPNANRVLIGATHEYKSEPLDLECVVADLKMRSFDLSPFVWEHGNVVRLTSGYRVQSKRGIHGRIPIIGRFRSSMHENAWIFTGLSSRGLIYHGIFGDILSDCIAQSSEDCASDHFWWKKVT